jgi:hypothetical protein
VIGLCNKVAFVCKYVAYQWQHSCIPHPLPTTAETQEKPDFRQEAILKQAEQFLEAFNARDAKTAASFFAVNAEIVEGNGETLCDRSQTKKALTASYEGVSMIDSFDDAKAEDRHKPRSFEMFGNLAIYHDAWCAAAKHQPPFGAGFWPMTPGAIPRG